MLWSDSASDAIIVSGLGMRPLLAAMLPLEAVVIELASERDLGWEGAVVEDLDGRGPWNLIDIRYKQHIALCRC